MTSRGSIPDLRGVVEELQEVVDDLHDMTGDRSYVKVGRVGRYLVGTGLAATATLLTAILGATEVRLRQLEVTAAVTQEQLENHHRVLEAELEVLKEFMAEGGRVVPAHLLIVLDAMLHRSASDFSERDHEELQALRAALTEAALED